MIYMIWFKTPLVRTRGEYFPANEQFSKRQSWSLILVNGQISSNGLRQYCQLTIWLSKYKRKRLPVRDESYHTNKKKVQKGGRLKCCETEHCLESWDLKLGSRSQQHTLGKQVIFSSLNCLYIYTDSVLWKLFNDN